MKIFQHFKSFWALLMLGGVMFVYSCSDVKVEVDQPYANAHQFDKTVYLTGTILFWKLSVTLRATGPARRLERWPTWA